METHKYSVDVLTAEKMETALVTERYELQGAPTKQSAAPHCCLSTSIQLETCRHPRKSFWNVSCSCLFSLIPDEILLFHIFTRFRPQELAVTAQVCKRWRFFSNDRILWQRLDLAPFETSIDDSSLGLILHRHGSHMESLKLCNAMNLSTNGLFALGKNLSQSLQILHLCNVKALTDDHLIQIADCVPYLKHLSLFGCKKLTDVAVQALGTHCKNLSELSLRGCIQLTDKALSLFGRALVGLNIADCRNITSLGIQQLAANCISLARFNAHGTHIDDAAVTKLVRNCPQLNNIHLSSTDRPGRNDRVTNVSLQALSALGSQLRCVNLQGVDLLSDFGMHALLSRCTGIERLNLGRCYRITDATIDLLAANGTRLTHLSLFQCLNVTDRSIILLLSKIMLLQYLDLHSCVSLTTATLEALLEPLDVASAVSMDHKHVTNDDIEEFNKSEFRSMLPTEGRSCMYRLPFLHTLVVEGCVHMNPNVVAQFQRLRSAVEVVV